MDPTRFDASLRALAASTGRRNAVRSLGAVGLGLLASLGLASPEHVDAKKKKKAKPGPAGPDGSRGPAGPTGPAGATGATGASGPASISQASQSTLITSANTPLDAVVTLTARCPNLNSKVLGGGYATGVEGDKSDEFTVNAAFPVLASGNDPEGYQVKFTRTNTNVSANIVITAFVNCTP